MAEKPWSSGNFLWHTALTFSPCLLSLNHVCSVSGGHGPALDKILGKVGAGWPVSALAWFGNTVDSSLEMVLHVFGRNTRTDVQLGLAKEKSPSELLRFPIEREAATSSSKIESEPPRKKPPRALEVAFRKPLGFMTRNYANGCSNEPPGLTQMKCGIFCDSHVLKAHRFQKWSQFVHKISTLGAQSFWCLPLCGDLGYKVSWLDPKILNSVDRGPSIYSSLRGDLQQAH